MKYTAAQRTSQTLKTSQLDEMDSQKLLSFTKHCNNRASHLIAGFLSSQLKQEIFLPTGTYCKKHRTQFRMY